MCGIVGRWNFKTGRPIDPKVVEGMATLIAHRGPDDSGVYASGNLGLGNRRLAIVDLSPAGHQPMRLLGRDIWVTYNGEIYNFPTLRDELERDGFTFQSHTDTEVLLAAYARWGELCVQHLRGMFAFAVWDGERQRLVLGRDRLGKKPLFYWIDHDGIAFASETKAFLADEEFVPRPHLPAISSYLTYQYVPGTESALEGVSKLAPAHYLVADRDGIRTERYWRLSYDHKAQLSETDAAEAIVAKLRESVRIRLISDVPLGAFLSGGVDSSAVVALMAGEASSPVKTFSIGFDEREYNELEYARVIAEQFETDHHEFVVRPDALSVLPDLAWCYSEPFADSSAVATYYLAKLTREHVTVALNGDGGDEDFAGYPRYVANVLAARVDGIPRPIRVAVASGASLLGHAGKPRTWRGRARRFAEALGESRAERYARWVSHFRPPLKDELCTDSFRRAAAEPDYAMPIRAAYGEMDGADFVDSTLGVDVETYLPGDLLVKMDIATMAHSVEARSPFLDHEFMELCASLPSGFKLRGQRTKYILKRALQGRIPDRLLERPKMGFGVPIDQWFRNELRSYVRETLLSTRAIQRGYFEPTVVGRLIDEHQSGTHAWHYQLWNLLMLELWHRAYIDAPSRAVISRGSSAIPARQA